MSGDDAVELTPTSDGIRLRLRVKPGARRDRLVRAHAGALKIEVSAAPERGKANTAVIALLAEALDLPRQAITITTGQASQDKTVLLRTTLQHLTTVLHPIPTTLPKVPGQRT